MVGSTFDVSPLTIFETSDTKLRGEDSENRIVDIFMQDLKRKNHAKDLPGNHRDIRRLNKQCERAKRTLSSPTQATVEIDPLLDNNALTLSMPKARFEELNMGYFQNSTCRAEKYLRDGGNAISCWLFHTSWQSRLNTSPFPPKTFTTCADNQPGVLNDTMHDHGVPWELIADALHVMQCNTREKMVTAQMTSAISAGLAATAERPTSPRLRACS